MGSAHRRKQKTQKRRTGERAGATPAGELRSHPLDLLDELLARDRPFGDGDYLHDHLHVRYRQRLERLSAILPVAGELSSALGETTDDNRYRVIGDPVVRHTIHQALGHDAPLTEHADVFRETIRLLKEGKCGPLESGSGNVRRLGVGPGYGWVWTEEHRDDVFGRSFRKIVHDNYQAQLCTPRPADLTMLAKGAELLRVLLPICSRSALRHTHLVVLVPHAGAWMQKGSCSEFRISGTIFINRTMLHNPWWVAEHLLHESLHQKLYDFRHTHSLLAEDLTPASTESAARVRSIWNVGGSARSNYWDTFRAVAAFHVYVHQAVLCLQAERRMTELAGRFGSPYGSFPAMTNRREALERAQYLGRQIKESCGAELGPAGRFLVDWLISVLNAIDPSPPPPESSYIHLLLNRYMIEAVMVERKKIAPECTTRLLGIIADEAETIRCVLLAINAEGPDLGRLRDAAVRRPDEGAGAEFLRFRNSVTAILQGICIDGYGFRRPPTADSIALEKMIEAMVERSSQRLIAVLEGAPQ